MTERLEDIQTLTDYIRAFGSTINEKVNKNHPPLFMPGSEWHPKLFQSLRDPYQGQGDAIMGVVETLKRQDAAFMVGEMGTGKSLIGALVPWVMMDGPRVLVMCPGHLTEKWKREIELTVPGADVSIVRNLSDAMALDAEAMTAGSKPRYWVMSKETGKLGYTWRPAVGKILQRQVKVVEGDIERWETVEQVLCPRCGQVVKRPVKRKGSGDEPEEIPIEMDEIRRRKTYCQCGEALWQVESSRCRKMALADYFKKNLPKNFFDFFIADEVHELKGKDTAQGNAFGTLASCSRKTICLTGTLLGGYASHLFYLNFRINPSAMTEAGFNYRSPKKFVEQYGVEEVVVRETSGGNANDNRTSKGRSKSSRTNERPGISPELFAHQLLDKAVFLHLDDVSQTLPPLTEDVIGVEMDPDVASAYRDMEEQIKEVMRPLLKKGDKSLLGTYLMNLLSYPDRPFGNPPIKLEEGNYYSPREFNQGNLYPKEKELLKLVQSELAEGRRCLVYAIFTDSRDVTARLNKILSDQGIKSQVLKNVKTEAREAWIKEKLADGMQVMICNPELVKTGLDLIEFPTIVYVQTGYSIFTLRQSSRRSWRIGQTQPVKVVYLYYKDTMQERAVALIGKKLNASLALEGKLTEKGLTSLSDTDGGALALAKSLAEGGIEGIETIWKNLRKAQEKMEEDSSATSKGAVEALAQGEQVRAEDDREADAASDAGDPSVEGSEQNKVGEPEEELSSETSGETSGETPGLSESSRSGQSTKSERRRKRKKTDASQEWRTNPNSTPGPDYRWTKKGWRKISEREKEAKVRREAEAAANAWKYDGATNPGEAFYWVRPYSYERTLKSGRVITVSVRGHWRKKRVSAGSGENGGRRNRSD